ncbi:MAG: hypothetical protein ABIG71_01335 [Candidatus Uhrbacteria bacterium]
MAVRKWNNRDIDRVFSSMREHAQNEPVISKEWEQALEARVRREVISRYGSFAMPLRTRMDVHTTPVAERGILINLRSAMSTFQFSLRPAMALASVAVVVVLGSVALLGRLSKQDGTIVQGGEQQTSSAVASAPPAPVTPGSGFAVSVFGGSVAVIPVIDTSGTTPAPNVYRASRQTTISNPAGGVFNRWGYSVFSEEQLMQYPRDGKNVFSS